MDTPGCGCPWDLRLTVAARDTAAAAGRLTRTTWAAAGARKTFHYSLERCTPPCHVAWAVGAVAACPATFKIGMLYLSHAFGRVASSRSCTGGSKPVCRISSRRQRAAAAEEEA